jgi:hypothetical protein
MRESSFIDVLVSIPLPFQERERTIEEAIDAERELSKRDWLASLAKSGDFPFLAIS